MRRHGSRRRDVRDAGMTQARRDRRLRPELIPLEVRTLLSNYIVSSIAGSGTGSLSAAIDSATADTTNDTITFSSLFNSPQTITVPSGGLDLTKASGTLTIDGPGANLLSISGGSQSGVFYLNGGTAYLSGLTITDGNASDGGGLDNNGGTANLADCTVSGNSATNNGGGLYNTNSGTTTLTDCTVSSNTATAGGGVYNHDGSSLLIDSTISQNTATDGGGLYNLFDNTELIDSTVSANTASAGGGLYNYNGGGVVITNSIIAGQTAGGDVDNVSTQYGYASSNDFIGGNPLLAPLGDYGGNTETMPPLPGSPVIGAGVMTVDANSNPITTDQRGLPIPASSIDIGAFQTQTPIVVNTTADGIVSGFGQLTLRQALNLANAYQTAETIDFSALFDNPQTITLTAGALSITSSVTILGPAGGLTISGGGQNQVFTVGDGTDPVTVTISDLTITDGTFNGNGAGVLNNTNSTLTLLGCLVSDNTATSNGTYGSGGGVWNDGTLTLTNCTFYDDSAFQGGGLGNAATATVTGCTFVDDTAYNPYNSFGGGAMKTFYPGSSAVYDTLMFGNSGHDIGNDSSETYTTGDYDWTGDGTAPGAHSQSGDPLLGTLGNYGGPTQTIPLEAGSPAIQAGSTSVPGYVPTDQRGDPRGAYPDIGAYEASVGYEFNNLGALIPGGASGSSPLVAPFNQALSDYANGNVTATINDLNQVSNETVNLLVTAGSGVNLSTDIELEEAIGDLKTVLVGAPVVPMSVWNEVIADFTTFADDIPGGLTGGNALIAPFVQAAQDLPVGDIPDTITALNTFSDITVQELVSPTSTVSLSTDIAMEEAIGDLKTVLTGAPVVPMSVWNEIIADFTTFADDIPGGLTGDSPLLAPFVQAATDLPLGDFPDTFTALGSFLGTAASEAGTSLSSSALTALDAALNDLESLLLSDLGDPVPSTTVSASVASPTYDEPLTFTALVTNSDGSAPAGSVQFSVNGAPVGNPVPVGAGGVAVSPSFSPLSVGTDLVSAVFTSSNAPASVAASTCLPVGQASAIITINGASVTYDGNTHAAVGSALGVETPTPANLTGGLSLLYSSNGGQTFTSTAPVNAGTYEVYYTFAGNTDYQAVTAPTDSGEAVNIGKAALIVTANNASKTYGTLATFSSTAFTETGLVTANGDTITGVTETSTGAAATATVAGSPYSIVPCAATGSGLSNYTIAYVNGTLTVKSATLTITANNASKTYGTLATFSSTAFTETGLVTANGDTITGVTETSTGAAATATVAGSPYSIVPCAATGSGLSNYTIAYVNGTLTVVKASPSISATPSSTIVPLGTSSVTLNDTAVLAGAYGETGTITFTLYLGGTLKNTETVSVAGNGTYTTPTGYTLPKTGTVAGLYQWDVSYSGDANNNSYSDNNAVAEQVMVVTQSSNLENVAYTITTPSGSKGTYSSLSSVQQGDTVTVNFTVASGDYDQLTLVSYVAPQSYYSATSAYLQTVAQVATGFFSAGQGSLTVTVPASYYQIDFVYGAVISQLGLSPSDFYNAQGRMQDSDNGGTTIPSSMAGTSSITASETASPAFWSSTSGAALIDSLNGGSSATNLGNWLATVVPNLMASAAGQTNAQIATEIKGFGTSGALAEAVATVMSAYVTDSSLAGNFAASYGFTVTTYGSGIDNDNVGSNGSALGLSNNTAYSIVTLLAALNSESSNGSVNGSASNAAITVFTAINKAGGIT